MKSPLAKARDKWFSSAEGEAACHGTATGQYLQNRLERAFIAGAKFSDERIEELEKVIEKIRLISERSYKLPVTSVAAMKNLKIINKRAVQALKGGD